MLLTKIMDLIGVQDSQCHYLQPLKGWYNITLHKSTDRYLLGEMAVKLSVSQVEVVTVAVAAASEVVALGLLVPSVPVVAS